MSTPNSIPIRLVGEEFTRAINVGVARQRFNLDRPETVRNKYGADLEKHWTLAIEGACGEAAFVAYSGLKWTGAIVGDFTAKDVDPFQIRTRSRHDWQLLVHPEDADFDPFVLVTGRAPGFMIRGWIMGHQAKNPAFWADPRGLGMRGRECFVVPDRFLRPMAEHPVFAQEELP